MQRDSRRERELARLAEAERRTQERMAAQRERIAKRFAQMRIRLEGKYGEPNDSQQRIIEAALALLKKEGLNNLSLRKLGGAVGMQAPAIYWHFKSKDELVDYMAEAILQQEFGELTLRPQDQPWPDWLGDVMRRLREAMLRYPDGARVVAGAHLYPAVTLGKLFECVIASLCSAGLDLATARHILMTASTYTFGFVIEEQASPAPGEADMLDLEASASPFPYVVQAMQEAYHGERTLGRDYEIGLQYIIKGSMAGSP